jgi:hypothetical protein
MHPDGERRYVAWASLSPAIIADLQVDDRASVTPSDFAISDVPDVAFQELPARALEFAAFRAWRKKRGLRKAFEGQIDKIKYNGHIRAQNQKIALLAKLDPAEKIKGVTVGKIMQRAVAKLDEIDRAVEAKTLEIEGAISALNVEERAYERAWDDAVKRVKSELKVKRG